MLDRTERDTGENLEAGLGVAPETGYPREVDRGERGCVKQRSQPPLPQQAGDTHRRDHRDRDVAAQQRREPGQ